MGGTATATLPANWKALNNTTVRSVDPFASAGTATTQSGGNGISTTATNGIYNFGAGVAASATDRAVGGISSSSASKSVNIYTSIKNNDANPITSLALSFDVEKYRGGSNAAGFAIQLYYSTDGTTWTSAGAAFLKTFAADADNSGYASAPGATATVSGTLTPAASIASGSTIYLAWNYSVASGTTTSNAQGLGIDNFAVTANYGAVTPAATITATPGSLTFSTTAGTASASQDISVSGSNLTGDITVTAPASYEVSTGTTYTSSVTLTQSGGSVSATLVHVRIAASASTGTVNGSVSVTSPGATTQTVSLTGTVNSSTIVDPLAAFAATTASAAQIDLSGTANAAGNNVVIAYNTTNTFGTPSGALVAGNTISGSGTVLYSGPASGLPFHHTGLNAVTTYYYSAWSVGASNTYSTALTANATTSAPASAHVVINQIYGGGGNSGGVYRNDFIELYNNENVPVSLAGWSVQYAGATATGNFSVTTLSGTIPAHGFYLIQEAAGADLTQAALPTPDATGTLAMSATAGKVLLCNVTTAQNGANPSSAVIMDKVGYGSTAVAYEGSGPAGGLVNDSATVRVTDGVDNNDNKTDFKTVSPIARNTAYITTAPTIQSVSPPNGITGIPSTLTPTIYFDKPIAKGAGNITVVENGNPSVIAVGSSMISVSGRKVTINATLLPNKSYYILIDAGAFQDVYGNAFTGISSNTTWAFTTYNSAAATTLPATFNFDNCIGSGLLPNGFTQYSVTGDQVWDCTPYGRNGASSSDTAQAPYGVSMNGYANGTDHLNKDWLISPKLDLTGTTYPLLSFYSRNAFAGDQLQLKISTDYTGSGNPELATWTDLNGKFPSSGSDVWKLSGGINLSSYKQSSVYIAFVYTSTNQDGARWTLDDISLVNSATPPDPSLTLSTNSLEFGYTAAGSSSTKTLTLTANDLVGDVTLTTTGNFTVSLDNSTFASSVVIPQATANNIPTTLYVKFSPIATNKQFKDSMSVAISDSTGKVIFKGNSIDPASTLNVVNWNMEWFATPDPTLGPTDKTLQAQNAQIVLQNLHADLFILQEVVNETALANIVSTMPGYAYVINNYGSHSNIMESNPSPLTEVQKLAFVYNTAKISNVTSTPLLSRGINTTADLSNPYYNDWASGRFPFMMTADVKLSDNAGGFVTHPVRFINIHAKANTAPVLTSYARREAGAHDLDSIIQADYPNDNVLIAGDFNDDLNTTITAGINPPVTSYHVFTVDHASLYAFPTIPLSPSGQHSDVSFSSVIDNVVTTKAMDKYYLAASATVLSDVSSLVAKYGTTTSDHYPVFSQYSFTTAAALPVKLLSFTATKQSDAVKLDWATSQETNSKSFEVERSNGILSFAQIGKVEAKGFSDVKTSYSFVDKQPYTGLNLYRLKQVDLDNKYEYSPVVKITFSRQVGIRVTPNPASTYVNISLDNSAEQLTIQLVDLNGR
ncbi:MAG: Ig-like domain-containing protein, partial [Bacteroidetes bacterium]|nr:Ig-like domain-containing protein [Bacteroidota bacterium]